MTIMFTCYEITHDGEGERGRSTGYPPSWAAAHAAQEASEYFDALDDQAARILHESDHLEGSSRVVEVCPASGPPERFRVRCRVVREYEAEAIEGVAIA